MRKGISLLIGGARSGKSALAAQIGARWGHGVTFIATGEPRDDEMRARIEQHRAQRDPSWTTVEEPVELAKTIREATPADLVIVDCLTLWVSNLLERGFDHNEIVARAEEVAATAGARTTPTIVITNEVGSGIVPVAAIARTYRDVLGEVNATFARAASDVLLVAAGRVQRLRTPEEVLSDDDDR